MSSLYSSIIAQICPTMAPMTDSSCLLTSVEDPVGSKTSRLDPPILIFDIRIRSRQKLRRPKRRIIKRGSAPEREIFCRFKKKKLFLVIRKWWIINKQTFLSLGYWYFILNNAGEVFFYLGNILNLIQIFHLSLFLNPLQWNC